MALELSLSSGDSGGMSRSDPSLPSPSIAVVGGGISGLSAAHRLTELVPGEGVQLYEASEEVGGVLRTVREGPYLIETSADNFLTRFPWASDLCERIGIADNLIPTERSLRRAMVVCHGQIAPVPESFVLMSAGRWWPIVTSPVLSVRGKLRLAKEPFIAQRDDEGDESVAQFARRRLGKEVLERLVQPLVAGIYTADPEKLSMRATLPQFVEQERKYGSLWRARRAEGGAKADSGAQYSVFVAPREGMSQMVSALAARLPKETVRKSTPVTKVSPMESGEGWWVEEARGRRESFRAVILALPAPKAAACLGHVDDELKSMLRGIEYASTSIVVLGIRRDQIKRPLQGFGFVVPQVENRQIIAASFASTKFPGRAPDDRLLVRVFIGGALQPELAELDEEQLTKIACEELRELVGLTGEPELVRLVRWSRSMPQYHVGHTDRVDAIDARVALHDGLELAGNAYRGVGVPQCIHSGEQAAERVALSLGVQK